MNANNLAIEFKLDTEDYVDWNYYYWRNNPQWKRSEKLTRFLYMPIMVVCFLIGLADIVAGIYLGIDLKLGIAGIILSLGVYIYFACRSRLLRRSIRRTINQAYAQGKRGDLGRHTYSILPEGIRDISEVSDSITKWQGIGDLVQTDKHLFILVPPMSAFIVPKRAFPDDSTFGKFAQEVKTTLQAHQKTV